MTIRTASIASSLLEINTQPGMTPTSLVPEQAAHTGMSYRANCAAGSWRTPHAIGEGAAEIARRRPHANPIAAASAPSARRPSASCCGKKKPSRDGFFTRVRDRLPEIGMPRRPILHLTWLLLLATLIAALFAGGYVSGAFKSVGRGIDAVVADAGFGISSVHLAGNGRTQPSEILAALGFEPGQSIFGADVQAARAAAVAAALGRRRGSPPAISGFDRRLADREAALRAVADARRAPSSWNARAA